MRVARRALLASTIAAIAAPAIRRAAFAAAPQITLKLHHAFSSVSSGHDKFLAPWARGVEAKSGSRIHIDIFPSMQLGGSPALLFDQVRDGTADIVWAMPSHTPGRFPKTEAFELPFVASRRALVSSRAIEDYAAANLKDEFREFHPICFSCADRSVIHTNRAIRSIADIRGLRLHVRTQFAREAVTALGAFAVPMPDAQVALAAEQHVIDGCIDPWSVMPGLKLTDVFKMHSEFADVAFSTSTFVLAMNKQAYERLPGDLKTVIDDNSGQRAAGMAGAMWDLEAAAAADMVRQRIDPISVLRPDAPWRKATAPVIGKWVKQIRERKADGHKLLESARTMLARYVNEPEPKPLPPARPSPPEAQANLAPKPEPPRPKPKMPNLRPLPTVVSQPAMTPQAPAAAATTPAPSPSAAPAPVAPPAPAAVVPPVPNTLDIPL